MKIITKEEFFAIILQGKPYGELMSTPSKDLHYLQLIFFKPLFAKISVTLFFGLSVLPLLFVSNIYLKILLTALMLWADYYNRSYLKVFKGGVCLYEVMVK